MSVESLAEIASQYQTVVTLFVSGGLTAERILENNPKRWYVEFQMIAGGGTWRLTPAPLVDPTLTGQLSPTSIVSYKFRDSPSLVTGEWFSNAILGSTLQITECLYIR